MGRRDLKYFILRQKYYFDNGFGLTSYFKYVIAFFGLASNNVEQTMILAGLFAVLCYILGFYWVKYHFLEAQNDIANQYNPFVRQTLKGLSKTKKFK